MASGSLLSKFTTLAQTFGYATDYTITIKIRNAKRRAFSLAFFNVLGDYFISHKKMDMYSKKRTYGGSPT